MTTLRHYRLCPHSRSIRALLTELDVAATLEEERPWEWRQAFLAINPAGELPVLETDEGAVLCGTYAIAEWLSDDVVAERAEKGPDDRPGAVFPGNALDRAEVRRIVDWFHGKMHREATSPLLNEKVFGRFRKGDASMPDAGILRAARANMAQHLRYIDHIAGSRKWLSGETLSFADFAAAGQISCVDYLGEIDWSGCEAAKLWYARLKSRPSLRNILSERIPGTPAPPDYYADPDF
ncbi:MAG: glutathione S-transferase family protein [Methyloligellaceae bacterium]